MLTCHSRFEGPSLMECAVRRCNGRCCVVFFKPVSSAGYMFCTRLPVLLSVRQSVRACVRDYSLICFRDVSAVSIDGFSPYFCHRCVLGQRLTDSVLNSKGQRSRSHHRAVASGTRLCCRAQLSDLSFQLSYFMLLFNFITTLICSLSIVLWCFYSKSKFCSLYVSDVISRRFQLSKQRGKIGLKQQIGVCFSLGFGYAAPSQQLFSVSGACCRQVADDVGLMKSQDDGGVNASVFASPRDKYSPCCVASYLTTDFFSPTDL